MSVFSLSIQFLCCCSFHRNHFEKCGIFKNGRVFFFILSTHLSTLLGLKHEKNVYFMSATRNPYHQETSRLFFLFNTKTRVESKQEEKKHINNTNRYGMPYRANCSKHCAGFFFHRCAFAHRRREKSFARRVVYIFLLASLVSGLGGVQSTNVEWRIASDRSV